MTDKFTIEQIEAAIESLEISTAFNADTRKLISRVVIAELTRSQWNGQEGEVYAWRNAPNTEYQYGISSGGYIHPETITERRPLTPDEVPAWKRDKEALKVAIESLNIALQDIIDYLPIPTPTGPESRINEALAKIKELTGE